MLLFLCPTGFDRVSRLPVLTHCFCLKLWTVSVFVFQIQLFFLMLFVCSLYLLLVVEFCFHIVAGNLHRCMLLCLHFYACICYTWLFLFYDVILAEKLSFDIVCLEQNK